MKKSALTYLIISSLLFFYACEFLKTSADPINLIKNPSVESSNKSVPVAWSTSKNGTSTTTFTYAKSGYDGGRSLGITVKYYKSGESKWMYNAVSIESGANYLFSDYYISNATTYIYAQVTNASGVKSTKLLSTIGKSSEWRQIVIPYSAPSDAKKLVIYHSIKSNGNLQTDKYSLTKVEPPAPIPPDTAPIPPDTAPIPPDTAPIPPDTAPIPPDTAPIPPDTAPIPPPPVIEPPSAPAPIAGNLLLNPSFEEVSNTNTSNPKYWYSGKYGTNTVTFSYPNSGHTGSRSTRIDISSISSGDAKWIYDPISVQEGIQYKFEDYYQANVDTEIDAEYHMKDGTIQYKYLGTVPSSTNWTKYTVVFTPPANVQSVVLFHLIDKVGYLITDDHYLSPNSGSGFNRALISLTFDDGFLSQYQNAFPVLKNNGMNATFYILPGYFGYSGYFSKPNVVEVYTAGNEIGSHTITHAHMTKISSTELTTEISSSQTILQGVINAPVVNFCAPYGEYSTTTVNAVKQYYRSHRTVDSGYNIKGVFDPYYIKVQNVNADVTVDMVKSWVDKAKSDKSWLVLVYHRIENNSSDFYSTNVQDFTDQVAYIKNSGVTVKTVNAALDELLPQQ